MKSSSDVSVMEVFIASQPRSSNLDGSCCTLGTRRRLAVPSFLPVAARVGQPYLAAEPIHVMRCRLLLRSAFQNRRIGDGQTGSRGVVWGEWVARLPRLLGLLSKRASTLNPAECGTECNLLSHFRDPLLLACLAMRAPLRGSPGLVPWPTAPFLRDPRKRVPSVPQEPPPMLPRFYPGKQPAIIVKQSIFVSSKAAQQQRASRTMFAIFH